MFVLWRTTWKRAVESQALDTCYYVQCYRLQNDEIWMTLPMGFFVKAGGGGGGGGI